MLFSGSFAYYTSTTTMKIGFPLKSWMDSQSQFWWTQMPIDVQYLTGMHRYLRISIKSEFLWMMRRFHLAFLGSRTPFCIRMKFLHIYGMKSVLSYLRLKSRGIGAMHVDIKNPGQSCPLLLKSTFQLDCTEMRQDCGRRTSLRKSLRFIWIFATFGHGQFDFQGGAYSPAQPTESSRIGLWMLCGNASSGL